MKINQITELHEMGYQNAKWGYLQSLITNTHQINLLKCDELKY